MRHRRRSRSGRPLGQHFLADAGVLRRIADAASVALDDTVLEVGPGRGALTVELRRRGARVVAVEVDRGMAAPLRRSLENLRMTFRPPSGPPVTAAPPGRAAPAAPDAGNSAVDPAPAATSPRRPRASLDIEDIADGVAVVWGDAVRLDWRALDAVHSGVWKVCSNLPYYITGPFLSAFFAGGLPWSVMVLTVQREVAERMAAGPGSRTYGAFSCLVQYHAAVERLFPVPRQAFRPPPAVESVVVRCTPRPVPPTAAPRGPLFATIRGAFAQRRKTLRNALSAALRADPEAAAAAIRRTGLDPGARPETLGLQAWGELTQCLVSARLLGAGPGEPGCPAGEAP